MKSCVTITLCDVAENHVGMQKLGQEFGRTYSYEDLVELSTVIPGAELYDFSLNNPAMAQYFTCPLQQQDIEPACLLVIRSAIPNADNVYEELVGLPWDTKAKMKGKVVNKRARHNLCFDNSAQVSDVENGKGTIIAWDNVPYLYAARNYVLSLCKTKELAINADVAEGNYYYDIHKCGIGYHGDAERNVVIGMRFGASMPLCYCWYWHRGRISSPMRIDINHGDIYIMSKKAVGKDWKKKLCTTLRHAAGCDKYVK